MSRGRNTHIPVFECNIAGEEVKIAFRTDENLFTAEIFDEVLQDANFNALLYRLKKKGKEYKPSVSIPITQVETYHERGVVEFTDYTVTGIHSRTKNVMIRNDKTGETEQQSAYAFAAKDPDRAERSWDREGNTPKFVRRLSADDRKALSDLWRTAAKAEQTYESTVKLFKIPIYVEIKKQQKKEAAKVAEEAAAEPTGDPRIDIPPIGGKSRGNRRKG